jgi:prevent-host-death family protein
LTILTKGDPASLLVKLVRDQKMKSVSLYEAKTHLSTLVDQAADGEEIIIAKNGVPCARLVPLAVKKVPRKPANALKITYIAPDFDEPDPDIAALFEGRD